ncbi:MAG TPA: hypothetical protein PKB06_08640, partial [Actinotalea sp.]|nr:hypothetical protein [Actinotalea sp.]
MSWREGTVPDATGHDTVAAPPFDSECAAALALSVGEPSPIDADDIAERRAEGLLEARRTVQRIDALGLVRLEDEVLTTDGHRL